MEENLRKIVRKTLNEEEKKKEYRGNPIDMKKLLQQAEAIEVICAGEYGQTYVNEDENKVFICVGDSHPFDMDFWIANFLKGIISKNYHAEKDIEIDWDMESGAPGGENWKMYKNGKFIIK